ncbi:MAG: hypothetical protein COB03_03235 [Alteromonas sp.]|nr:MAG: hypothetical protein COB03_03235 [Alteromonas sp.]
MRKTILVIGAAIGLATAIASTAHAELPKHDIVIVAQTESLVDSKLEIAIAPTEAFEIEREAYLVGFVPTKASEHITKPVMAGEATKLANVNLSQHQITDGYRHRHEVGWRF